MGMKKLAMVVFAGLVAGFVANGVMGAVFSLPAVKAVLYDPRYQSRLFIELTPQRDLALSVGGLVVLSVIHSWLFEILKPAVPGKGWFQKGLFWGFGIWAMYWLFQEWFVYHTLLREPLLLNLFELWILLTGSLVEGVIISAFLARQPQK